MSPPSAVSRFRACRAGPRCVVLLTEGNPRACAQSLAVGGEGLTLLSPETVESRDHSGVWSVSELMISRREQVRIQVCRRLAQKTCLDVRTDGLHLSLPLLLPSFTPSSPCFLVIPSLPHGARPKLRRGQRSVTCWQYHREESTVKSRRPWETWEKSGNHVRSGDGSVLGCKQPGWPTACPL